jgi:hypothetical protein
MRTEALLQIEAWASVLRFGRLQAHVAARVRTARSQPWPSDDVTACAASPTSTTPPGAWNWLHCTMAPKGEGSARAKLLRELLQRFLWQQVAVLLAKLVEVRLWAGRLGGPALGTGTSMPVRVSFVWRWTMSVCRAPSCRRSAACAVDSMREGQAHALDELCWMASTQAALHK